VPINAAYRFARGLPARHTRTSEVIRNDQPLDFLVARGLPFPQGRDECVTTARRRRAIRSRQLDGFDPSNKQGTS